VESAGYLDKRRIDTGGAHAGRDVAGVIEQTVVGTDDDQRGGKSADEPYSGDTRGIVRSPPATQSSPLHKPTDVRLDHVLIHHGCVFLKYSRLRADNKPTRQIAAGQPSTFGSYR